MLLTITVSAAQIGSFQPNLASTIPEECRWCQGELLQGVLGNYM